MSIEYTRNKDRYFSHRFRNTEDYWKERAEKAVALTEKTSDEMLRDMKEVYQKSIKELNREIEAFYGRYAIENGLTLEEVHKRLDPKQLKSAKEEIKRYYDFADPKKIGRNMSREYRDELRRLSARAYMSRLEEIKMKLKHIVVKLGAEQERRLEKALKKTYADTHARTAFTIDKGLGFSGGYTAPSEDALTKAVKEKWLESNYSERIWKDKGLLLTAIDSELLSGIAQGHNPRKIAEAMSERFGLNYNNCERLARTEMLHAMNSATYSSYKEHGVEKYQFVCGLDERTCPECGALDGQTFEMKYAVEGVNYPVIHPNCVLGDNVILAPDAECLTRSEYSGNIFKFTTTNGRSFSVTPNHIMLTTRGWVRAKNLIKGDKVIYYSAWDKVAVVGNPTDNDSIPTIEQLFTSLTKTFPMLRRVVPAAAEYFKGDVVKDSKIDIVFIDRLLRDKADTSLLKFFSDFSLIKTGKVREGVLNSDSSMAKLLVCFGLAADFIMESSSIADVFFGGSLTHHQLVSLRLPSDYNTRLIQSMCNGNSTDTKSFRKFINASAAVIKGNNLGNRQIKSGIGVSDSNSVIFKDSDNRFLSTTENLSDLFNRFSAFVEFDNISSIRIENFTGHVYDVSSMSTLYICNGYLSSNCRCSVTPVFEDEISELFNDDENTRLAYDEGRNHYDVPASMTYKQWRETVEKKD